MTRESTGFAEAVRHRREQATAGQPCADALAIVRRLGRPVFPLGPRSKVPLPGSHGFKDASTDEARIRQWWRETPAANIGLPTGNGLAVLDVDPRNGGNESLERLEAEHGKLPATLAVVTGGNGRHFYFRTNGHDLKSGSDRLGPGLDIKGEGGYVVAPGSTHESGKPYCWDLASQAEEPADAPPWLVDLASSSQARTRSNGHSDSRHWHLLAQTMRDRNRYDQAETLRRALDCTIGRELVGEGRQVEIERMVAGAYAKPAASEFRLTDGGNSERFVAAYGDAVRYCHTHRRWYVWSGRHWQRDESGEVDRLAKSVVLSMYGEAGDLGDDGARTALVAHAKRSDRADKIRSMLELARSEEAVAATDRHFDTDPWLLNVENGTLDLRTCDLREHRPGEMLTHMVPVAYDSRARFGRWLNFLLEVFDGDEDLTEYVQRAVGYSLTGSTREQCFFLLYGTGANGKSTFLEVIRALLNSLAQSARFESFLVRRGESIPNDIARMRGARFVTAIESEGERRLSEATIKSLTGGDTVTARFMRAEFFEFKPEFKLWLAANHKPVVRGTDLAIWRRVKLLPFTVTIPEYRRDPDLADKLREELPGVLAWGVEGCRKWLAEGLGTCEAVDAHTRAYKDEQDILREFLDDRCEFNSMAEVERADLYQSYRKWCEENGDKPIHNRTFSGRLRDREIKERVSSGKRYWIGLRLKEPA